jgi:hypothetical protein
MTPRASSSFSARITQDRVDQSEVREGLREVAQVTAGAGVDLLGITATKLQGSDNDAYIDNVSLSLLAASGQLPAPTIGKTLNVAAVNGKVFVRLPVVSRVSRRALQLLHASVSGHFRMRRRYAAATVRGTVWDMIDRCDGTLTRVPLRACRVPG